MTASAILLAAAISGCSVLHRPTSALGYVVRGSSHRAPTITELADKYGCTSQQIAANGARAHLVVPRPGSPMCGALGRYGNPISVGETDVADMRLVSMLHLVNDRYYDATYVYYEDTKVNRKLGHPVGRWIVERVTVTR